MNSYDEVTDLMNGGNPSEFSRIELQEEMRDVTGSRFELTPKPLPADGPKQRPDITLVKNPLDWSRRCHCKRVKPTIDSDSLLKGENV